jgi:hypothetical protein
MGFSFLRFGFLVFLRRVYVYVGSCAKARRPHQTRHPPQFFIPISGILEIASTVLESGYSVALDPKADQLLR